MNYKDTITRYLRQKGSTNIPRVFTHVMPWFGEPLTGDPTKVHKVNYNSNSATVIEHQLENMMLAGIDGVIVTWYGPQVSPFMHQTAIGMNNACNEKGLGFMLLMDPWICKNAPNKETAIKLALQDPTSQAIMNSPSYVPEKYILDFSTGSNLGILAQLFPSYKFLGNQQNFAWPNISSGVDPVPNLAQQNNGSNMQIPAIFKNFSDGGRLDLTKGNGANGSGRNYETSVWTTTLGSRRVADSNAGSTWLRSIQSLPGTSKYVAIVSWNDYDEGTAVEDEVVCMSGIGI